MIPQCEKQRHPPVTHRARIITSGRSITRLEVTMDHSIRLRQAGNYVRLTRDELLRVVDEVLAAPTGVSPAKAKFTTA